MIVIVAKRGAEESLVSERLRELGARYVKVELYGEIVIVAWPDSVMENLRDLPAKRITRVGKPYPLASREWRSENTVVEVGGVRIGGKRVVVAAGPCAVESEDQIVEVATELKKMGASMLRAGAFKPRTSPYTFQGLGEDGLRILRKASEATGLPVVSEATDPRHVRIVAEYADMVQIGARNSQNFPLLIEAGRVGKPVLLKRGFANTIEEWLLSAEYILLQGNGSIVLCERGVRTFERETRFTLDVSSIPVVKKLSHLPVCADPSHPAGRRDLVAPLALASLATGADMLLIEVHPDPDRALSDSAQQLSLRDFGELMEKLRRVAEAVGREV